jgi:diacylglycerol kinase (ATP)
MSTTNGTAEEHEQTILAELRKYNIEPKVYYTTLEDPGNGLAAQAAKEGAELVIAAGGDGTIHAVATGLIRTQSTLGIIAVGTMNNLAHSLSIPDTIEEGCQVIAQGVTRTIDIGVINQRAFVEVAGIGLEAALFPAAEEIKSPGLRSTIQGVINGLRTLFTFKPTILRISLDGRKKRPYKAIEVTICNSPYYGAHFQVAPGTLMDDGLLDVVIYKNFSKLEYLQHAFAISQGRRPFQRKMIHRRVKSMGVESNHPVEIQVDGSPQGYTPATVHVLPGALRVRVASEDAPGLSSEPAAPAKHVQSQTSNVLV